MLLDLQAEKKALVESVQLLEARKAFLLGSVAANAVALAKQQHEADELRGALQKQKLATAAARSAVTQWHALTFHANPIERHIELGTTWRGRVAALRSIRPGVLQDAERYMLERLSSFEANPICAFNSSESFTVASGDVCFTAFDMMPLGGVTSVKQVHDALNEFFYNIEIMWTELSGELMVREGSCGYQNSDSKGDDPDEVTSEENNGSMLHHFLIGMPSGVQVESKSAMFNEYSPGSDTAIIASNAVDHDALSPYKPQSRLRQDVSSVIMVRSHPIKRKSGCQGKRVSSDETSSSSSSESEADGADSVVVMSRYHFIRFRSSALKQSPELRATLPHIRDDTIPDFTECFRIMTDGLYNIMDAQRSQQAAAPRKS